MTKSASLLPKEMVTVMETFSDQTVAIIGLGREGRSSYQFLRQYAPESVSYVLIDQQPLTQLDSFWKEEVTTGNALFFSPAEESFPTISHLDQLFVSAGISDTSGGCLLTGTEQDLSSVKDLVATITNNLDLTLALCLQLDWVTTIGVTGTKGKSTTTALIDHVLSSFDLPTQLGGNIGTAPLETLLALLAKSRQGSTDTNALQQHYLVLEMSSHQLFRAKHSPHLAVVQAVTPEHLDFYRDFDQYLEAKATICRYQSANDVVFYNAESETAQKIAELSPGLQRGFSASGSLLEQSELQIPGKHNLLNAVPSILVADHLTLDVSRAKKAVHSFTGLPHRLELVTLSNSTITKKTQDNSLNQRRWINDSLATTPEATTAALESVRTTLTDEEKVFLVTGGFDRGLSYKNLASHLAKLATENILRGVCYFPDTGQKIIAKISNHNPEAETGIPLIAVKDMQSAIDTALTHSLPGDVVLLSPASASFNLFKDYADRGDQFKKQVQRLLQNSEI